MYSQRYDILGPIHKGLRNVLSDLQLYLGRLNFNDDTNLNEFNMKLHKVWKLLHVHADGEDRFLFTNLEKIDKEAFDNLENEHHVFIPLMNDLEKEVDLLPNMKVEEKEEEAFNFIKSFNDFIASYFTHLQNEEMNAMPILWENYSDKQLREFHSKSLSVSPPEIMEFFLLYLIPAITEEEKSNFFKTIKINSSKEQYQRYLNVAEKLLTQDEYQKLKESI